MKNLLHWVTTLCLLAACSQPEKPGIKISGELLTWHKITLTIPGPETAEYGQVNPFLDYRLEVTFTQGDQTLTVPGFYAADGNAAETSSQTGNVWMVRFRPGKPGSWNYQVRFLEGENIAVATDPTYGRPVRADGQSGSFTIGETNKEIPDFRARGRLEYAGSRYLKFSGDGSWWLKNGADSPENFLAFADFDQTYRYGEHAVEREGEANPRDKVHHYEPHVADWNPGDPVWQGEKGKGMIGAVNYLASKGINSQYMLTMNILGDGKDVWPYSNHNERYRFDCSKLDQWEIVFDHMQSKGIMLHFVLQETENECLLDMGFTEVQRKLYLRELVARFGHHLAVTWNLGEENGPADWTPIGQTDPQKKAMAGYLKSINPYPSFVVLHTHANDQKQDEYLTPMLGFANLDGASMQVGNPERIHKRIKTWIDQSKESTQPWVVCMDELGPHWKGVMPDSHDPGHDTVRSQALWGALMAGAGGAEWYFGYRYPHNDLSLEDFRSRDGWWNQTATATRFFLEHVPFAEMENMNHLLSGAEGYCLARPGKAYLVYLPKQGGQARLNLADDKEYRVKWFDPKSGVWLNEDHSQIVKGPGVVALGAPPAASGPDCVALLK